MGARPGPRKALFIGAGASKPLKGPGLEETIKPVADLALRGYPPPGVRPSSSGRRLADYLQLVHGIGKSELEQCLNNPTTWFPGIVELLTVLDLAISDDSSFGRARWSGVQPPEPEGDTGERQEFSGNRLRRVRRSIVGAIANGLRVETSPAPGSPEAEGMAAYATLVNTLESGGAILTSNWDSVIDRLLWEVDPETLPSWRPGDRRVVYSPLAESVVDFFGTPIAWEDEPARETTPLIKLHGSLNWLYCPRCSRLIVSPTLDLAPDDVPGADAPGGRHWVDRTCWCEAEADALIVTPSYSKNYGNIQLRAIWREGLHALAQASEWTFVGYSLPSDDFAIRALITRALAWKRSEGLPLTSVRVYDFAPEEVRDEAERNAAGGVDPKAPGIPEKSRDFLGVASRYRAILAEHSAKLRVFGGGLLAAAAEVPDGQPPARR